MPCYENHNDMGIPGAKINALLLLSTASICKNDLGCPWV